MKTATQDLTDRSPAIQDFRPPQQFNSEQPLTVEFPETQADVRSGLRKKGGAKKAATEIPVERRQTHFNLDAPAAQSVQLAGDFTEWEKSPVKMIKGENGIWQTVLPLPPGRYLYRFLVDDKWRDDPRCSQLVPNPFGSMNAIVEVR